ncbi:hypothetical protein [Streptomyces sp. CBMAI 2042]|uniref:hypothetical protein n=1 Tax=Streptomyces sp. CBMAI 2042 TaxID=2305222 RepID=UPI001F2C488D|nr:hypothetical protein [Streptomyces sp. CBMAI 2042]
MAMGETIVTVMGGLGSAGIGCWGTVMVQKFARRGTVADSDAGMRRADEDLAAETVATARVAGRAWWMSAQWLLAALEAQRRVDIDQYEEQLRVELKEFTEALYRVPTVLQDRRRGREAVEFLGSPTSMMVEATFKIMAAAHRVGTADQADAAELAALRRFGGDVHGSISALLMDCAASVPRMRSAVPAYLRDRIQGRPDGENAHGAPQ